MKKTKHLWLIAFVLAATRLSAQDTPQTPKKYKWEVAVDVNHHIFKESGVGINYFVRVLKSNNQAWRFTLNPSFGSQTTNDVTVNNYGGYIDIGHEWAKRNDNFRFYYGFNTHFGYATVNSSNNAIANTNATEVGLYGLGGLQYYFLKRLSVSLEAQSGFFFRDYGERKTSFINWNTYPISGIYLAYQF